MNRKPLILLSLLLLAGCAKTEMSETPAPVQQPEFSAAGAQKGIIYVKLAEVLTLDVESSAARGKLYTKSMGLNSSFDEIGAQSFERVFPFAGEFEARTRKAGLHRWYRLSFDETIDVESACRTLMAVNGVTAVSPVHKVCATTIPFNDPYADQHWTYENKNFDWADINVIPVWENYTTGDSRVIVSVVDSGVDLEHEDLVAHTIPGGPDGSKCFLYSHMGYEILPDDHGTHVAGTIAAVNNNGIGVCGIAGGDASKGKSGVKILSCEILHGEGKETLQGDDAAAIKWGADHGALICNNSWGYDFKDKDGAFDERQAKDTYEYNIKPNVGYYSSPIKDAIDYFNTYAGCDADGNQVGLMKGGLVVFAAGNDTSPYGAPACYPGAFAVGSISQMGVRSSFSNYGDWVDIAAPGGESYNIISTICDNKYTKYSGTSMAAPHVSGVAALVVSACGGPGFTREDLIAKLIGGANSIDLDQSFLIGPLVDALGAVEYDVNATVPAVTDFSVEIKSNIIDLDVMVPSYANPSMNIYGFNVLASKSPSDWTNAVVSFTQNASKRPGEIIQLRLSGLEFDTNYYVAVEAVNSKGKTSAKSDTKAITTGSNHAPVFSTSHTGEYLVPSWKKESFSFEVSDPDGHAVELTYTPGNVAEEFFKITDTSYSLSVDGSISEEGLFTATFLADDGFGMSTEYTITYTVMPNSAPVLKKQIEDIILSGKGQSVQLTIDDYITDPDGEALVVKTSTSGSYKVVDVNKSGNKLTVKAAAESGFTTVTVTASDSHGKSVKTTFNVMVRPEEELATAYPNPVSDVLSVATGLTLSSARIRIVSQSGGTVVDKTFECSAFAPAEINMAGVAPGRYTLHVEYDELSYSRTIIKL